MNNLNDNLPKINPTDTSNATIQRIRIDRNDPKVRLSGIMNHIFNINREFLNNIQNSNFSPELNFIMVYIDTIQDRLPLNSLKAQNLENLANIIHTLNKSNVTANDIKKTLAALNYNFKDEKVDQLLINSKMIYCIAIFKFFINNLAIDNIKNCLFINKLDTLIQEIIQENDLEIRIEKFISSFKNIFESALTMIFSEDFSETSQMDLKGLFQLLHLCNINVSETSLNKYLSRKITENNKNSYNFVFTELINAYNSLPKKIICNNNVELLYLPKHYSFLNLDLLKTINTIPYFKENYTNLPFNIDLTILNHQMRSGIQIKSSSFEHILKLRNPAEDFSAKFAFVKSSYLDKYSYEQIFQDKIYRPIIEYLMNSDITQVELQLLIFDLMPYYSLNLIQDLFNPSSSSNFVREIFQQLNAEQIQNFASYSAYQHGYTFEIARFIDNFNLFSDDERINFLLSSKPFVIESFLSSYSKFIPLNPINSESIFIKFIELFKHKEISANIMTKVFDWIDSINDINTSEELVNQYCTMLIDAFQLDGLNLIPQNIFHHQLALTLYGRLKSMGCQIPDLNNPEDVLTYCRKYTSEDLSFNPSKFSLLPAELKSQIGSYLKSDDLKSLVQCNKADSEIYKELYNIREHNNLLKNIFINLFPEFNWNDERASFSSFFIKTNLDSETLQNAEELFEKLNSNQILSLRDQKIFLNIIQELFFQNFKSEFNDWNIIPLEDISNSFEAKEAFFKMIDQVFTNIRDDITAEFLMFLYKTDIELPSILIDNIILNYRYNYEFFKRLIIKNEFKLNKFLNMYFFESWLLKGYSDTALYNLYFAITGKFNDIEFIKKLFQNPFCMKNHLLEANLPKDVNWRLDLVKQVKQVIPTFVIFSRLRIEPLIKFLSFNGNNWTNDQIVEMANLFPLQFIECCLETYVELKYGFSLHCYPREKVLKFIEKVFIEYGYQKIIHNYITKLKLKISNETIFKFGIHKNTDFKDFHSKFSTILKKQQLKLDFKDIKSIMEVFCMGIGPNNTRFDIHIDFFTGILDLTKDQKVEIFTMILETMKLQSLTAIAKTNIFNDIARTNDELFTSTIKNIILNDDVAKTNFTRSFKAIKKLIGEENANHLRNSIKKRKARPSNKNSEPNAKRKKKS